MRLEILIACLLVSYVACAPTTLKTMMGMTTPSGQQTTATKSSMLQQVSGNRTQLHKMLKGRVILANTREEGSNEWGVSQIRAQVACQRIAQQQMTKEDLIHRLWARFVGSNKTMWQGNLVSFGGSMQVLTLADLLQPTPRVVFWTGGRIRRLIPSTEQPETSTGNEPAENNVRLTWTDGRIGSPAVLGLTKDDVSKLEPGFEYCLALDLSTLTWQARDCNDRLPYACLVTPRTVNFRNEASKAARTLPNLGRTTQSTILQTAMSTTSATSTNTMQSSATTATATTASQTTTGMETSSSSTPIVSTVATEQVTPTMSSTMMMTTMEMDTNAPTDNFQTVSVPNVQAAVIRKGDLDDDEDNDDHDDDDERSKLISRLPGRVTGKPNVAGASNLQATVTAKQSATARPIIAAMATMKNLKSTDKPAILQAANSEVTENMKRSSTLKPIVAAMATLKDSKATPTPGVVAPSNMEVTEGKARSSTLKPIIAAMATMKNSALTSTPSMIAPSNLKVTDNLKQSNTGKPIAAAMATMKDTKSTAQPSNIMPSNMEVTVTSKQASTMKPIAAAMATLKDTLVRESQATMIPTSPRAAVRDRDDDDDDDDDDIRQRPRNPTILREDDDDDDRDDDDDDDSSDRFNRRPELTRRFQEAQVLITDRPLPKATSASQKILNANMKTASTLKKRTITPRPNMPTVAHQTTVKVLQAKDSTTVSSSSSPTSSSTVQQTTPSMMTTTSAASAVTTTAQMNTEAVTPSSVLFGDEDDADWEEVA